MVDQDEFEAWLEEPITRLFLKALENYADQVKDQFEQLTWSGAYITPQEQNWLAHLRGRASAVTDMAEMDFELFEVLLSEEEKD